MKSADADRLRSWYRDRLGLPLESDGVKFKWRTYAAPEIEHFTAWDVFPADSVYCFRSVIQRQPTTRKAALL